MIVMGWMFAIRYLGPPNSRRLVIHRNDDLFWSGSEWVDHHSQALLYGSIKDAQHDYPVLQQPLVKGKLVRKFSCTFNVFVTGNDINKIEASDVRRYLNRLMHIGLDYEAVSPDSRSWQSVAACTRRSSRASRAASAKPRLARWCGWPRRFTYPWSGS